MKRFCNYIHFWEIEGFAKVNKKFGKIIKFKVLRKFSSVNAASEKLNLFRDQFYRICDGSYTKIKNLIKITDSLNLQRRIIEKNVTGFKDQKNGREYNLQFPFKITPLHLRLVAHILGDGSISTSARWGQNDTIWLENLIKKILKISPHVYEGKKDKKLLTIPFFLVKITCAALNLKTKDLKSHRFIDACLLLPKEYRIQMLSALVVDEGNINRTTLSIRMSNKSVMESICKLIDSLGYERSKLHQNNFIYKNHKYLMYAVHILGFGMIKFHNDLKETMNEYGKEAGLWQKQSALERRIKTLNLSFLISKEKNKQNIIKIQNILNRKPLKIASISKMLSIDYHTTQNLLKKLERLNIAKKISYGKYVRR